MIIYLFIFHRKVYQSRTTVNGDQLLNKFPNLRLRDLPVFCSLPKPFPRHFAWAQPLEVTASKIFRTTNSKNF